MHPGAVLTPALMAVASGGGLSGRRALTAFVAGFELQERIGIALQPFHYARGFHTTATVGTLGAATTASRALGGSADATRAALSLAAAQAAGLKSVFGTIGKPLQVARSSSTGVVSALLALDGHEVGADAVFGRGGIFELFGDGPAVMVPGDEWLIEDMAFKTMASCFASHAAAIATLRIRASEGFTIDDVEAVTINIPAVAVGVCTIPWPSNGVEGKFSLAYVTAVALTDGAVDESAFEDDAVNDPRRLTLRGRVDLHVDSTLTSLESVVHIELTDGRRFSLRHDSGARAWVTDPAEQWPTIETKFVSAVTPVLGAARASALVDDIRRMDEMDDVSDLGNALLLG
jgi:2-methylcitrate dehydratase PrpD